MNQKQVDNGFYHSAVCLKLTEARQIKLHSKGWGLLTEYYLESVKISNWKGKVTSCATIRISDRSGQVTCAVRGPHIGLLFGLTKSQWTEVENMCNYDQQLFYRYFKNGINKSYSTEQKIFYNFCMTSQKHDVLVAKYQRCPNMRNKFKSDAFLDILELRKCDSNVLDLYISQLRFSSEKNKLRPS
ncbi:hypothetical protein PYW08_003763 [Mythimna loreyi]|uniref:Uncharacterized protein n=1 Tax=Mythimna loreyi TaxID=667449 RepID=A0ACC2QTI7_9NEOP|nr:hypothetical protein PYW08_003763 [Mythimna loreyi]